MTVRDTVTVFVVNAYSLESLRRAPADPSKRGMPEGMRFDRMLEGEKPLTTEMGRFFTQADAERFRDALHSSWHRPYIQYVDEYEDEQHHAHGGTRGQ